MKQFVNIANAGPVSLPTDEQGNALLIGGGALIYTAYYQLVLDVDNTTPQTIADGGASEETLAAAQRARITSLRENAYFTYVANNPPSPDQAHVIKQNETVIIDGNANIRALSFLGTSAGTAGVTVTLEG